MRRFGALARALSVKFLGDFVGFVVYLRLESTLVLLFSGLRDLVPLAHLLMSPCRVILKLFESFLAWFGAAELVFFLLLRAFFN
jgi:hypothetical protein